MSTTRRDVLRGLGAGALGVLGGVPLLGSRSAWADGRPYKVLEVFLSGGVSSAETYFVAQETAQNQTTAIDILPSRFDPEYDEVTKTPPDPNPDAPWLGGQDVLPSHLTWPILHNPAGQTAYDTGWNQSHSAAIAQRIGTYWANPTHVAREDGGDAGGVLGPAFVDAVNHPLLLRNASIVPLSHGIEAHPPGVHLMLTGTTMGRSYAHGLGAMIQRHYGRPGAPAAFVINVGENITSANFAASTGALGAEYRPPILAVGPGADFGDFESLLARPDFERADPLLGGYKDRYLRALGGDPWGTDGSRSEGFGAYRATVELAAHGRRLQSRLGGVSLDSTGGLHQEVGQAFRVASRLLAQDETQYVCVVLPTWFDSHTPVGATTLESRIHSARSTTYFMWKVLAALGSVLDPDSSANPHTPLDLEGTLVLLNTEFGRKHETTGGSAHWPFATGVMLLGGPVLPGVKLRGGQFRFESSTNIQVDGTSPFAGPLGPSHLRKALHAAALPGYVPFDGELGGDTGLGDHHFFDAFFGPA